MICLFSLQRRCNESAIFTLPESGAQTLASISNNNGRYEFFGHIWRHAAFFIFTIVYPWKSTHNKLSIKSDIEISITHVTSILISNEIKSQTSFYYSAHYANKYLSNGSSLLQWGTSWWVFLSAIKKSLFMALLLLFGCCLSFKQERFQFLTLTALLPSYLSLELPLF